MNTQIPLRRLVLLGTPLALVVVGLIHPQGITSDEMMAEAGVMFALHLVLIPVFSLMGLAGYWLTDGLSGRAAAVSRLAMPVFVILYTAYDTAAGVSTSAYFSVVRGLTAEQQDNFYQVFVATAASPQGSAPLVFFVVGTLAWIAGMIAASVALGRAGVARGPRILLVLAGVLLIGDHSRPLGSIAFGCFFLAAAWLEFMPQHGVRRQPAAT